MGELPTLRIEMYRVRNDRTPPDDEIEKVIAYLDGKDAGRRNRARWPWLFTLIATDTLGRFEFGDVAPGTYLLGFQHVAVDSLGLGSPLQRVDVRTASTVRTSMAVPSMKAIIKTVCQREGAKDSLAVLLGSIRHSREDRALPGAFVSLRWGEVILGRDGSMQRTTPIVDVFANDDGWFTACVPGDVPMTVRAMKARGVATLVSEQNLRFVAAIADRAVLIEQGHLAGEVGRGELLEPGAALRRVLGV